MVWKISFHGAFKTFIALLRSLKMVYSSNTELMLMVVPEMGLQSTHLPSHYITVT